MPVTKSAKKALLTSTRRHTENLTVKAAYRKAGKVVRKAVQEGGADIAQLFSKAQSALDTAAKSHTIHPNKAARLKSRLAKHITATASTPVKKETVKKATTTKKATKTTPKKAAAKKAA